MSNITINQLPTANGIDPTQDILPIYTASLTATQGINRNTLLGLASAPVGLTDSQTLTNKILTSPTISGPTLSGTVTGTYTIGGTPTFPSTVVSTTGIQTLTNKTLTSPTINAPTITNAAITADAVTGFTSSSNGTIYGISVTGGTIGSAAYAAGSISSAAIATNGVSAANLATNALTLGYAQTTTTFTSIATPAWQLVTGLTVTVTIPAGSRKIKITVFGRDIFKSGGGVLDLGIWDGAVGGGTQLADSEPNLASGNASVAYCCAVVTPAAGTKTYNVGVNPGSTAAVTLEATSTAPAFILVEAI
jgi:hypothetical protein